MEGFFDRPYDDPRGRVVSQKELCSILGIDRATVGQWQSDGAPYTARQGPGETNQYNVAHVIRWLHLRAVGVDGNESAHCLLARAKTRLIELDIAEKKGTLIRVDEIEPGWSRILIAARNRILQIQNHAPELVALDVQALRARLDALVRDALEELAVDPLAEIPDPPVPEVVADPE